MTAESIGLAYAALLAVMDGRVAIFDADDRCVAATPRFGREVWGCDPAGAVGRIADGGVAKESRVSFEPRAGLRWWTATPIDPPATRPPDAALLTALLNAVPAMLSAKDAESRYLFMNQYQSDLYGVAYGGAVGLTAGEILGSGYGQYTRSLDETELRTARPIVNIQEHYADAQGRAHHWLTTKAPFTASGDPPKAAVATLAVEISALKSVESELRDSRASAVETDRMKSSFIVNLSHELRNPLNAVIGFAELLSAEPFGPLGDRRYLDYLQDIVAGAGQLTQLINDAVDIASLEFGGMAFEESAINTRTLVHESARFVALEAAAKGISLEIDLPGNPPTLWVDRRRMGQVLINILSNALRHAPTGGSISFAATRLDDGGVAFDVADAGPGMTPKDIELALTPFGRRPGDSAGSGPGLGLPIAKSIIDAQGGSLHIRSQPGHGTSVRVVLPRERLLDFVLDSGENSTLDE